MASSQPGASPLPPSSEAVRIFSRLLREAPQPRQVEIAVFLPAAASAGGSGNDDNIQTYPGSAFAKMGEHLGIRATDVPKLAREFRDEYRALRTLLVQGTNDRLRQRVLDVTACLLLTASPDNSTAWSDRKRAISLGDESGKDAKLEGLKEEFTFVNLLLTQHSKAPSSWAHRRWLCRQYLALQREVATETSGKKHEDVFYEWYTSEIIVCTQVAERFPKNYYAWTHRCFVVQTMMQYTHHPATPNQDPVQRRLATNELDFVHEWLRRHVSDHSCVHYGGFVLVLLVQALSQRNRKPAETISKTLQKCKSLIQLYPSHEVLWIWRRRIGSLLIESLHLAPMENKKKEQLNHKSLSDADLSNPAPHTHPALSGVLQSEILNLWDEIDTSQLSAEEVSFVRRHAASYTLWMMEQLHRRHGWKTVLGETAQSQLGHMQQKMRDFLSKNSPFPHLWNHYPLHSFVP